MKELMEYSSKKAHMQVRKKLLEEVLAIFCSVAIMATIYCRPELENLALFCHFISSSNGVSKTDLNGGRQIALSPFNISQKKGGTVIWGLCAYLDKYGIKYFESSSFLFSLYITCLSGLLADPKITPRY